MYIAIAGIALEIIGFIFIIKSTPRLVLRPGGFTSDHYVNPKTNQPPPEIEGQPDPLIYRPGIVMVMIGLGLQIADIIVTQVFKFPY
jgi:hypothetical protein